MAIPIEAKPDVALDSRYCDIYGVVVDEASKPIAGAEVLKRQVGEDHAGAAVVLYWAMNVTDANGTFAFLTLQPDHKRLAARHAGYNNTMEDVFCTPGKVVHLVLVLRPGAPYHVVSPVFHGRVGCMVGVVGTTTSTVDLCDDKLLGVVPGANSRMVIDPDLADVTGIVVEASWEAKTMGAADCFAIVYPIRTFREDASGITIVTNGDRSEWGLGGQVEGRSPLTMAAYDSWERPLYPFAKLGFPFMFQIRGGNGKVASLPETCPVSLAMDQPYTMQVTVFYNGDPIPPRYTQTS